MNEHIGAPGAEPKNGDFVAYLEELERRQARALATSGPASVLSAPGEVRERDERPPLNRAQAEAVAEALRQQASAVGLSPQNLLTALVLGGAGLVFILIGLGSSAGLFGLIIGAVLLWLAVQKFRGAARGAGDLAERLKRQQRQR